MSMTLEEKRTIAMRINKRIRDIVNKSGFASAEFEYFETRLTTGTLKGAQTWTKDDESYYLLSRSQKDLEKYSEEDLRRLEETTRTWSQIKEKVTKAMEHDKLLQRENNPFLPDEEQGYKPPTNADIAEYLNVRKEIRDYFNNYEDLIYTLIDVTGWSDVHQKTDKEILEAIKSIPERQRSKTYSESAKDKLRAEYKAKRKAENARRQQMEEHKKRVIAIANRNSAMQKRRNRREK